MSLARTPSSYCIQAPVIDLIRADLWLCYKEKYIIINGGMQLRQLCEDFAKNIEMNMHCTGADPENSERGGRVPPPPPPPTPRPLE